APALADGGTHLAVDPARLFAAHLHRTRFSDLPAATVAATKRDILDTFGCMLGGSGAPGIPALLTIAARRGGCEEASVLVHDQRLPAPEAALINAAMGHALDFDDTLDHGGSMHPGVSTLAAAIATAEMRGHLTGQDLVLAVTLGLDISCRIALAATLDRGWHRTASIGVFGATAASGKLLALTADQIEHALGIALSFASGSRQCIVDGALTKRLQAGQAARDGILSALLAAEDFTGTRGTFAGRFGFFELYQPNGYDLAPLTSELGSAFRGDELSFKPYPCGRPLHAALDAAIEIREALGIARSKDVADVEIMLDGAIYRDQFEAGPHRARPRQIVEAQFGLPFLIALALIHGKVGIADVARLGDRGEFGLAARIKGHAAPEPRPRDWARIAVRHADGRTVARDTTIPIGAPDRPLSAEQSASKFRDCARNAECTLPSETIDALLADLAALEHLPDIGTMLRRAKGARR
ncbi:MAG: MmgE/PrpD family protein, partial [Acetobacteraceae bacterium]|nr:MmgE/PrpD family protein [Acetobacteraceae bacterium]